MLTYQRCTEMPVFDLQTRTYYSIFPFLPLDYPQTDTSFAYFSRLLGFLFCIFLLLNSYIYCFTLPIITQKSMASGDNKIHQHVDLCPRTHTDTLWKRKKRKQKKEKYINWQTIHLNSSRNDLTPTAALPLYCCFYFIWT